MKIKLPMVLIFSSVFSLQAMASGMADGINVTQDKKAIHANYVQLNVENDTGDKVLFTSTNFPYGHTGPVLQNFVKVCSATDNNCAIKSTCEVGRVIEPGASCKLALKTIPVNGADNEWRGTNLFSIHYKAQPFSLNFASKDNVQISKVINLSYDHYLVAGGNDLVIDSNGEKKALLAWGYETGSGNDGVWSNFPNGGLVDRVNSMAQDKYGDLYLATTKTLERYNGTSWKSYKLGDKDKGGEGGIHKIYEDADGNIVLGGTFKIVEGVMCNGFCKFDVTKNEFSAEGHVSGHNARVESFVQTPNNELVVGGMFTRAETMLGGFATNLALWNGKEHKWEKFPKQVDGAWDINSLAADGANIYASADNGVLYRCNILTGCLRFLHDGVAGKKVLSLVTFNNGDIIFGGDFESIDKKAAYGIARYNTHNGVTIDDLDGGVEGSVTTMKKFGPYVLVGGSFMRPYGDTEGYNVGLVIIGTNRAPTDIWRVFPGLTESGVVKGFAVMNQLALDK